MDDEALARAAAKGDGEAMSRLLARHYDRLHRIAWRMTGARADAEDAVQETCLAVIDGIRSFRGDCSFATWSTACVMNACRDAGRRAAVLGRLREGFAVAVASMRQAPPGDPHRIAWLSSGIARLPPDLRATVVLVAGEGMTHAEAGRALDVAEATVSWRMHEARKRLRFARLEEALDVR